MSDRDRETNVICEAIAAWRDRFGRFASFAAGQDTTGYGHIAILAGSQRARVEYGAFGWTLMDLTGDEPLPLTEPVRHPLSLTTVLSAFLVSDSR